MSKSEDKIINNMKFARIFKDNLMNNPWLLNYEKGYADIPKEEGGGKGTVFSTHAKTGKNSYTVIPTIMENEDGNLQFYKNHWDEAKKRGYGISFSSDKEAKDFSKWLSKFHEMSIENQQSYGL